MKTCAAGTKKDSMGLFGIRGEKQDVKDLIPYKPAFVNPFERKESIDTKAEEVESNKDRVEEKTQEPKLDDLISNGETQIRLAQAHDNALGVLNRALGVLETKLDDMKPESLPSAINATAKVVDAIQRQRIDSAKNAGNRGNVHLHFYTPTPRRVEEYQVVEVG